MRSLRSALDRFSTILATGTGVYIGGRIMSTHSLRPPQFSPNYTPVAVFVGGTGGIGQAMVEVLGRHTTGNTDIIIVGRNRAAAEATLAQLPKPANPQIKREFIRCDVTLGGGTKRKKVSIRSFAAHYYSRWKFIDGLLPALRKANEEKEDAKVVSIFSTGKGGGTIDMQDLGLRKTYSLSRAATHAATYNDLMVDEFAARNPDLAFIHAYPGAVRTNLLASSNMKILRVAAPALNVLLYPFLASSEECAENMWAGVFNDWRGAYQVSSMGDDLKSSGFHGTLEQRQALWEHTLEATEVGGS